VSSEAPHADPRRVRVNVLLYVVAMAAAAFVVVLAVLLWRELSDDGTPTALPEAGVVALDEAPEEEQERYGDVIESATNEATAFVNIRYDDAEASIEAVMAGATGEFREQYAKSTEDVIKILEENKSVMEGEVLWTGVVAIDPDSATVVVATTGTVANIQTENKPVARNFRLQMELVLEEGKWLTRDLQFVS
jgi:Mce-associated membrane protein